jgi:hypothetical protein
MDEKTTKAAIETKRAIGHAEAREIAHRFINSHFHPRRGDGARITIPADTERDDDILILSYIGQQQRREAAAADAGEEQGFSPSSEKRGAESSLVDALEKAAEQFEFYAREHREKAKASFFNGLATAAEASLEKAGTNQRMADSCRIALSHYRAGKEKADG